MEREFQAEGVAIVSAFLGSEQRLDVESSVNHKLVKSPRTRGELSFSRKITKHILEKLKEQNGMDEASALLDLQDDPSRDGQKHFTNAFVSPQGKLCLELNQPIAFTKTLLQVAQMGSDYGRSHQSEGTQTKKCIVLINDNIIMKQLSGGCGLKGEGCGSEIRDTTGNLSLNEGRSILAMGVLSKLLESSNHTVYQHHQCDMPTTWSSDSLVENLLRPYSTSELLSKSPSSEGKETSTTHFLSSLLSTMGEDCLPSGSPAAVISELTATKVDGGKFLLEHELLGKGGYDRNIRAIPIHEENNVSLSLPTQLAYKACQYPALGEESNDSYVVCHWCSPGKAFQVQQAMVLQEMFHRAQGKAHTQYLVLSGGVKCVGRRDDGNKGKSVTLSDVLRMRLNQVTTVYAIKYGEQAKGTQLQGIARRVTEAVLKFELLSSDMHSEVKLELPEPDLTRVSSSGRPESEMRFPGAFVLYNYARLATILTRYDKLCTEGTYPPLPSVEDVDFSLLRDEVEWQLLFHFVMHFPSVVEEAALLKKKGAVGIHVEVSIKKICTFLVSLSHLFSSYYSRIKIIMSPEMHLVPLIHARLHLVSALRQVMLNALTFLDIQPLNEL